MIFNFSFFFNSSYKLVVVGGGAGGCSTASKFAGKLGKGQVAVIEPNDVSLLSPSLQSAQTSFRWGVFLWKSGKSQIASI